MEDYLHKEKSLALSLCGVGKSMDDDEFIICILWGLGYEFDPILAALNARDVFPCPWDLLKELLANSATLKFDFKEHEQLLPLWLFIQIVVAQTQSHLLAILHHYELKRLVSLAKMEALLELVRNKPHIMVVVDVVVSLTFDMGDLITK